MGNCITIESHSAQPQERYKVQPRWQQPAGVMTLDETYAPAEGVESTTIRVGKYKIRFGKDEDHHMGSPTDDEANQERAVMLRPGKLGANGQSEPGGPVHWTRGELIGQGAFGKVYMGLNNETGQLMAVKQVAISKDKHVAGRVREHLDGLEAEVNVLRRLDHPNIVRYLGTDRDDEHLNIFLEFVPGGSIASLLNKFGSFKESVIRVYARQILLGLDYLHKQGIMHRDIKGANILVDTTGLVKVADFGASKQIEDLVTMDSGQKSIKGTPYWMAPEIITSCGHGRQADIWSVACTVIEMATGKPPWSEYGSSVSALFHIAQTTEPPVMPPQLSKEGCNFLLRCFNRNPKERPTSAELLKHPWLADLIPRSMATPLANISVDGPTILRGRGAAGALPSPIPEGSASLSSQTDRSESSREAPPAAEPFQHLARPPSQPHLQHPADRASQESVGSLLADAQRVRSAAAAGPRPESSAQGSPTPARSARPHQRQEPARLSGMSVASSIDRPISRAPSRSNLGPSAGSQHGHSHSSGSEESDYNPVEEPSWNIAASFDAGVFQNGASWLSPLGSGAAAVSPPKASPQREQSESPSVPSQRIEYMLAEEVSSAPRAAAPLAPGGPPSPDYTRQGRDSKVMSPYRDHSAKMSPYSQRSSQSALQWSHYGSQGKPKTTSPAINVRASCARTQH
ncbi:hypothetical protein CVIRNUC_007854 [Coccomyxa viridis]|uniref:mitogen-activated protein kinase kinase kinase n=1 Tax=Coccomyxa viridis TaxID=1274662 RepID=A0AAV1IEH4_9CHLO|nr:hypothetical protein CVIRNUC_007854 [Coccomyxa viridis]